MADIAKIAKMVTAAQSLHNKYKGEVPTVKFLANDIRFRCLVSLIGTGTPLKSWYPVDVTFIAFRVFYYSFL